MYIITFYMVAKRHQMKVCFFVTVVDTQLSADHLLFVCCGCGSWRQFIDVKQMATLFWMLITESMEKSRGRK